MINILYLSRSDLDRPAKELHRYELCSILDSTIRATNAQYDDPEILSQIDVHMMNSFEGKI